MRAVSGRVLPGTRYVQRHRRRRDARRPGSTREPPMEYRVARTTARGRGTTSTWRLLYAKSNRASIDCQTRVDDDPGRVGADGFASPASSWSRQTKPGLASASALISARRATNPDIPTGRGLRIVERGASACDVDLREVLRRSASHGGRGRICGSRAQCAISTTSVGGAAVVVTVNSAAPCRAPSSQPPRSRRSARLLERR